MNNQTLCLITSLLLIAGMITNYIKYRSLLAAPVIYPALWVLSLLVLSISTNLDDVSTIVFLIILISYLLFSLGFLVFSKKQTIRVFSESRDSVKTNYNWLGIQIVFLSAIVIGFLYIFQIKKYVSFSEFFNNPLSLQRGINSGLYAFPKFLVWLGVFIRCTFWYFSFLLIGMIRNKSNYLRRQGKTIVFLFEYLVVVFLTFIWQVTHFSRNSILFTLLPLLMMYFLIRKKSNKKIMLILSFGFIAFLVFFFWFNKQKFSWDYTSSNSGNELNIKYFSLYLSGSFVGLAKLIDNSSIRMISFNGLSHTFTLLLSIIDTIFGTSYSPDVVQEFVEIGDVGRSNVFTVVHWTASDLGLLYSFAWMFLYGALYGVLYKKAIKGSNKCIYFYSLLFYSLSMMFFQDQLLAISESWFFIITFSLIIFTLCEKQPKANCSYSLKISEQF